MRRPDISLPSRLKIERAKHHINDLNGKVKAFLSEQPFEAVIRIAPKAKQGSLAIKRNKPVPDEISLIAGDAVHNLRSALDLLMFALIGGKVARPETVQFPFGHGDEQAFMRTIETRQIKLAGKKVVDEIVALKPYRDANSELYGLHSLDLTDKHQLLIAVGHAQSMSADQIRTNLPFVPFEGPGVLKFTGKGPDLLTFPVSFPGTCRSARRRFAGYEEKAKVQPSFEICFGPNVPFAHHNVVAKLHELAGVVSTAVSGIANAAS